MLRLASLGLLVAIFALIVFLWLAPGGDRTAGRILGAPVSGERVGARDAARRAASAELEGTGDSSKQILFGDLHVHTTFSIDALVFSLPLFAGEGAHPPADTCDFARHCAALDFFSINDHAEGLTPARWTQTKQSIRECNERASRSDDPDLVAYMGFEWTQTGSTPDDHYGHRNVIFPGLDDDELPERPITALPPGVTSRARAMSLVWVLEKLGPLGLGDYADFLWLTRQIATQPDCPIGVDTRELPVGCRENASTPAELFEKLAQWGLPRLVIPHGLGWGIHAPPGAHLDALLEGGNHDPESERLLEVMSGHGNSEEFRPALLRSLDHNGEPECSEPSADFLPCCWQAGELVRQRCGDLPAGECEQRVREARQLVLEAGVSPQLVLPETRAEDWLDCDQCRDCFKPTMSLRPRQTAQYGLALSRKSADGTEPRRLRWGFIASTDNHTARPGTGYKQYARRLMTDARGFANEKSEQLARPFIRGRSADSRRAQPVTREPRSFAGLLDVESEASFMYPGGIVAAHSTGRDRASIWDALMRREVYGTSGPRMLLWFHQTNAPGGPAPMGSEVAFDAVPSFEVRAVGAWVQEPGCPSENRAALPADRFERLCRGECYHPGEERHPIEAIEIVRVRAQRADDEPADQLIDDPWRTFECDPDPSGCVVRFEDPDYPASERSTAYYARALQRATPAINAENLRTEFDAEDRATRTNPCHGGFRTRADDDCLAPARERAWSSPIYVDPP